VNRLLYIGNQGCDAPNSGLRSTLGSLTESGLISSYDVLGVPSARPSHDDAVATWRRIRSAASDVTPTIIVW
jgi:energy-converting hydrogenase Eha subunit B